MKLKVIIVAFIIGVFVSCNDDNPQPTPQAFTPEFVGTIDGFPINGMQTPDVSIGGGGYSLISTYKHRISFGTQMQPASDIPAPSFQIILGNLIYQGQKQHETNFGDFNKFFNYFILGQGAFTIGGLYSDTVTTHNVQMEYFDGNNWYTSKNCPQNNSFFEITDTIHLPAPNSDGYWLSFKGKLKCTVCNQDSISDTKQIELTNFTGLVATMHVL